MTNSLKAPGLTSKNIKVTHIYNQSLITPGSLKTNPKVFIPAINIPLGKTSGRTEWYFKKYSTEEVS
jgi:hypothetical protein